MRNKQKPYPKHDADKDIDTNENPSQESLPHLREWQEGELLPSYRMNVNEGVRDSPPPLPNLIFDPENSNKSLVGSTTSIEDLRPRDDIGETKSEPGGYGYHNDDLPVNNGSANGNINADIAQCAIRSQRTNISEVRTNKPTFFIRRNPHNLARGSKSSTTLLRASAPEGRFNSPEEIAQFIGFLRKERSKLLQEIEQEEEIRSIFYSQLEAINHRLRHLPPEYNVGCERWKLEGEMCRVQEALVERLGTPSVILHRRDQRLHNINGIEKTIQRLRQDASDMAGREACSEGVNPTQETLDLLNANQVNFGAPTALTPLPRPRDSHIPPPSRQPQSFVHSILDETEAATELDVQSNQKLHPTVEAVLRGAWPFEKGLWHSSPATVGLNYESGVPESVQTLMSSSSVTNRRAQSQQQLLTNKVEMVYGLLSMFSSGDKDDMSKRLLAMSSSPDSCVAMRQSGCLPLLIQLLHGGDEVPPTRETRIRAAQALQNIVHSHPDDKRGRREARILRFLSQIRDYSDFIYEELERTGAGHGPLLENDTSKHPCATMAAIMKLSFDEDHRHAMCALGGLHTITEVIIRDHEAHGSTTADQFCITLRRYAGMALTNLTFGDGTNKSLLCSFRSFMRALVLQLNSPSEELKQVTASILRNLSWRADSGSKTILREVGAVKALVIAALSAQKESTLKVILSAVWNMSSHCSMNKADICSVDHALAFICSTLTYKSQAKTLSIVENGGGILRNISSHIAMCDDLRQVLRDNNAINILLAHLRSPSLTVVSNACGTLWNLSARCPKDQLTLWELGAVPMLRSLINSKHKMISMGSSAALKNLLHAKPEGMSLLDHRNGGMPSLQARRQRALVQELDPNLSETCDNIETSPRVSPTAGMEDGFPSAARPLFHSFGPQTDFMMSDSRETVASTHSDKSHDRIVQPTPRRQLNGDHYSPVVTQGTQIGPSDMPCTGPRCGSEAKPRNGHAFSSRYNSRGESLHSKVSFLDNKYCNGANKLNGETSSRLQSAIDERQLPDAEDYTTDFAYRYSEEGNQNALPISEDCVQTFCTEGTPYETPYPRSTAGSFSDLTDTKPLNKVSKRSLPRKEMHDVEIEDLDEVTPSTAVHPGNMDSPTKVEEPVHYCLEDTPVSLSRYSSISSISSAEMNDNIDKELLDDEPEAAGENKRDVLNMLNTLNDIEQGAIQGNDAVYDETPLMFSRTTSVGSLSSADVQSMPDDRSSVISDFSRMTSGALSPSDLPDSPSQTMPVTPRRPQRSLLRSDMPYSSSASGCFRETTIPFMEEDTPTEFSSGTSLSNLTYEGIEIPLRARSRGDGKDSSCTNSDSSQTLLAKDAQQRRSFPPNRSSLLAQEVESQRRSFGGDEPTEEMRLAALIQSGMPGTRRPKSAPRSVLATAMHPVPLPPPPPSVPQDGQNQRTSSIPIKTANLTVTVESIDLSAEAVEQTIPTTWVGDTLRTFCTEDTPASISDSGSISDLSGMSIPVPHRFGKSIKSPTAPVDPLNDSYKRQVLENCIQSGMPKPRPTARSRNLRQEKKQTPAMPSTPSPKSGIFHGRTAPHPRTVPVARIRPQAVANDLHRRQIDKPDDHDNKSSKKIPIFNSKPKIQSPFKAGLIDDEEEIPQNYVVENTPTTFSRNSSLSSILDGDEKSSQSGVRKYDVEWSPACFSPHSSLSSLSFESCDDETTLRETAVLQKCIREGMPKTKSDLGERHSIPKRVGGSRIPSLRSPGHVDTGLATEVLKRIHTSNFVSPIVETISSDSPPRSELDEKRSKSSASDVTSEESKSTIIAVKAKNSNIPSPEDETVAIKSAESSSRSIHTSLESRGSDGSMCDSLALSNEALRMARTVANGSHEDASLLSYSGGSCIDQVNPPSMMDNVLSLSNSNDEKPKHTTTNVNRRIECRHTLIPAVFKRALGDLNDGGSLASSCHSNIDNIPPPTMVAEDDMESSMISVDSITSEVVETKDPTPSMGTSINSEMMVEIAGTAHNLAHMLLQESFAQSSATIVAGDEESTYQELTELEKDATLCDPHLDIIVDELRDIPELPFDSPRKAGPSPRAAQRNQLSKLKERHRSENSGSSSVDSSRSNSPKSRSPKTSRQRRVDEPERFKTRTISYQVKSDHPEAAEVNGNLQHFDGNEQMRRSFRQRRHEDPLRYRTRTIASPVTALKDQHEIESTRMINFEEENDASLTVDQMEAFSQDANIVICSLNETREDMMDDLIQLSNEESLADMDTLSLISNDEEDELVGNMSEELVKLKPRIVKPGEESCRTRENQPPAGKVVRGRRRGLFRHDRHPGQAVCATKSNLNPVLKPTPCKNLVAAAKLPRATRASTLRHNSHKSASSGEESSRTVDSSGSAGSSPRAATRPIATKIAIPSSRPREGPPPLQRQNTFTKEDKDGCSFEKQQQRRAPTVQQRGICRPKNR